MHVNIHLSRTSKQQGAVIKQAHVCFCCAKVLQQHVGGVCGRLPRCTKHRLRCHYVLVVLQAIMEDPVVAADGHTVGNCMVYKGVYSSVLCWVYGTLA